MEKAVAYIRVSTEEQAREGVSLEMQTKKAAAYAELNDLDLVQTFSDEGISAKSIKGRPGLQAALAALKAGEARHLVVYKLDRLARNTVETLEMAEDLKSWGCVLHSISEKLDTDSAIGKFFFTLIASLAEMERNIIAERTASAMQSKKENGERVSLHAPIGHTFDGDKVVADKHEAEAVAKAKHLRSTGETFRTISRILESEGYFNRKGNPYHASVIRKMVMGA